MIPVMIGIGSGIFTIFFIVILKFEDKKLLYGMILSGIGFLYVGFGWTDLKSLILNSIQAILFLLIAGYGVKRKNNMLAAGYLLHGCWDIVYTLLGMPGLIPPHYDWFCLSIDCTICIYLLYVNNKSLLLQLLPKIQ